LLTIRGREWQNESTPLFSTLIHLVPISRTYWIIIFVWALARTLFIQNADRTDTEFARAISTRGVTVGKWRRGEVRPKSLQGILRALFGSDRVLTTVQRDLDAAWRKPEWIEVS
jgi:hypothetical protein